MGIVDKIKEIEAEMARTQKNKATEGHLGMLKAKLAKLRAELLEPAKGSGGKGEGFDVSKTGDARVALIGFPSVGKSTLLSKLTGTSSEAAAYEFTTLTCIPGNIFYKGTKIQLLDLPGIIEGAAYGKGRGRQVIAVAKSADLVMMVLDAAKEAEKNHRAILERELETVGLRLNKLPPDVNFRKKMTGGVKWTSTVALTHLGEDPDKTINNILHEYRIHNAEITFRQDVTTDEFIDVILGNRKYVRCLYVYNKIDTLTIEDVDALARLPDSTVMSCHMSLNLDFVLEKMWEYMELRRVYTKKKGQPPDLSDPLDEDVIQVGCAAITIDSGLEFTALCVVIFRS
ncbi:DRG1 [Symbiodinium sp. KB8]|nr:DRG1 [Symbiodinium sp. KB8]